MNPFEDPFESPESPGSGPTSERKPTSRHKPETAAFERREAGMFQRQDLVAAREIPGFKGFEVALTLQKKHDGHHLNEDNILADPRTGLLGVFDGVGGSAKPALASRTAEQAVIANYERLDHEANAMGDLQLLALLRSEMEQRARDRSYRRNEPRENLEQRLRQTEALVGKISADPNLVKTAWTLIEALRRSHATVQKTNGSTTACIGKLHASPDGRRWAIVTNVGDSGAFIRHADGRMEQITEEDSMVKRLIESGALSLESLFKMKQQPDKRFPIPFSDDGIHTSMHAMSYYELSPHMTASIGGIQPLPSLAVREVLPGEELLFCTDGVIDKFEKMVDATTDRKTFTDEQTDFAELSFALDDGSTLAERLDNLRVAATFRAAYKITDDIAIVAARVEEKE
ncbi:MAG: hypothetical protein WA001_04825 [Patescibacteria group bacterium]